MSANDDKRIQSIETYTYGKSENLISKKYKLNVTIHGKKNKKNWLTLITLQKKNIKEHNPNWPQIPDHPYRI